MAICHAQTDTLLEQANRQLTLKAYGRAIELYTQLLTDAPTTFTEQQRVTAQADLAYAYRQAGSLQKAERAYHDLTASTELTGDQVISYLRYAQLLGTLGKYQESQAMYDKYNKLKGQLSASAKAGVELTPALVNSKKPIRYRLEVLALNTGNAEFSPMYYRDGLVYVSGKKGGSAIETTGSGGGSGYLDLYYIPDRSQLKVNRLIKADGSVVSKATKGRTRKGRRVGDDAYTRPTANDSRTTPNYNASLNVTAGLGYNQRSGAGIQPFSRALNSRYHEGPVTFFSDGSRIIFTRNNYDGRRVRQSVEGVTNLKLYTALQQNGNWVNVEELPFNSNDYSVGHPALSKDDQLLFFASDMPGGLGGTDLYVARFVNGKWSKPVNLGKQINTKGNELFPYVDEKGNLYFASDGRRGLGGLDIYYASLVDGSPTGTIEHLDAPINSAQDDFGLITDSNRKAGYLSTNRQGGNDDIFRFVRESSLYGCRNLTLRIYDEATQQPIDSAVVVVQARGEGRKEQTLVTKGGLAQLCLEVDNRFIFQTSRDGYVTSTVGFSTSALVDDSPSRLEISLNKFRQVIDTVHVPPADDGWGSTGTSIARIRGVITTELNPRPIEGVKVKLRNECDGTVQEVLTKVDGHYEFTLAPDCDHTLIATKGQYGTNASRIKKVARKSSPAIVTADVKMLQIGDVVKLDNISYDLDKWTLRPDASRELDGLVTIMQKYPTLTVEIRSHTDSRGDASYNRYVSAQRANSVANYLAAKGISRKRIVAAGYGGTVPLNDCVDGVTCTETEYQRNRRTEFKVLSIK